MQIKSIVEYIGGQTDRDKQLFPLALNYPYVISWIGEGYFAQGKRPAIALEECPDHNMLFLMEAFRELQPPMDLSFLFEQPKLQTI